MNEIVKNDSNSMTNTDKYLLTDCGKKLLEVLINPEHIGKTITEKCQIAGISRDTLFLASIIPSGAELNFPSTPAPLLGFHG